MLFRSIAVNILIDNLNFNYLLGFADIDLIRFFIKKDETTYSVENKAGVGFINEAMRGTLKIVKTSSDGKVKGFAFRVTGANGYDMTFETDKNGEIVIEGLRIGEYTISEVANNASAAYITPADQNVTIKLDETAVVKIKGTEFLRSAPTG